jgi:large repetitive protein
VVNIRLTFYFAVEDNCDANPAVVVTENITALVCGYELWRTYTASDACGNSSIVTQLFTIVDTTALVIDPAPADVTVECDNVPFAPTLTATDVCDQNVSVTMTEEVGDVCPYTITLTWTATDDCGNSSSVSQTVPVDDTVAPVFDEYPSFLSLSCELLNDYIITAPDNCNVTATIIEELAFSSGCYGSVQRTYKAEDDCGNFVTAVQLIQIVDNTDPLIFNIPADIELSCGEEIPAPATDIYGTDNCTALWK